MKRRTRKKPGQPKVVIQDWMALRPYDAHSDYDLHYLRIANKIYERIFNSGYPGSYIPEAPDPAMLACIIASYYEDYVCEIGIWKAFTSRNKELYGYYLPFYESEQYDPGYINPEDISYLLWHFWGKWNDTFFAPDWELFTTLGRKIYDYLEPMLDNALGTDFYERFFTVKGDEDFFDVKERLKWFAEGSYLFATDLYFDRKEKILAEKPEYQENAPQPLEGNMIGDIPEAGGIGVFFNREEGIIIVGGILDVIQLMEQKEPLNREAAEGLFEALTNYDPALVKYLLDNYPTHNVSIPIEGCETNLMKYIWFVNRYQRPDDFGEVFPNITMMDRELWEEKRS